MDKKKLDQKIVGVYTVVGAVAAIMAQYIIGLDIVLKYQLSLVIPFGMYLLTLGYFVRGTESKERSRIIFYSFFTLFLVWATVWIFFINL
jgi:hypothetical protein